MSAFLSLASDFIERMSNPAYGIRVNEDNALRFATLLREEGFEQTLRREMTELNSTHVLTAHGWLWLLNWARSQRIELQQELLLDLLWTWNNLFMQTAVIDLATVNVRELHGRQRVRSFDLSSNDEEAFPPLSEINNQFLRAFLLQVTNVGQQNFTLPRLPTQPAEQALLALLQINREVTLQAAGSLLRHPWIGQKALVEFYESLRSALDPETQETWDLRLGTDFPIG